MKHIFIINPAAGKEDSTKAIKELLENADLGIDYELYPTKYAGDGTRFIKETLSETNEEIRFYSCGGDGTLNEVVNGVIGFSNASITVYPCGSGNDYIKYYGTSKDFSDIKELVTAENHSVDVLKMGDKYSINAIGFGIDGCVLKNMFKAKRKPIIGKNAYTFGVAMAFLFGMKTNAQVFADGEEIGGKKILLATFCNGSHVGGSYKTAPLTDNSDGLMEVCVINPISRLNFLRLMNTYKEGLHLEDKRFRKYINYKRAKSVRIISDKKIPYSVDGELIFSNDSTIEIIPEAVNFAVPKAVLEKKEIKIKNNA
ncbi:MAG: YegS/Rv2252/BmrU family lipid kinase [Clostridia bacterium]|nr:YegS/Rv2252/BmrU family lipid kinase [Clostridia bacterium]